GEAFSQIRKAQALDPLSAVIQSSLGNQLLYAGEYDRALIELDKALQLSPDFPPALWGRGDLFLMQKRFPEAVAECAKARKKTGDMPQTLGRLGYAYARAGRTNEAREIIQKLERTWPGNSSASAPIAFIRMGLGESDQFFAWLESAAESHDWDPRAMKY